MASCPFSKKVAVVERRWVGGACPAVACLPSKNELWSIRVAHLVRHSAQFGTLTDVPRAAGMGHHLGSMDTSETWASACNKLIHRVCGLFPRNFIGAGMLPQSPNVSPKNCIAELERCVRDYGFVGVKLNPDPSGGYWTAPPLSDRYWYPIYEKLVELDVPAMIHVSHACNPAYHTTGSHLHTKLLG